MRANSPSAFFASLSLHGLVVALMLLFSFYLTRTDDPPPMIFELVAGAPTAPNETEAPQGGSSFAVNVPKIVLPPDPVPVVKTEPTPVREEVVPTPPKVEPKPVTQKPTPVREKPKPKEEPAKTLSYEDFVKQHGKPATKQPTQQPKPIRTPRIDVKGIAGGVKNGSTANTRGGGGGTAMSRPEQSLLDNYIAQLLQALRLAHEKPPGLSDQLETTVTFNISANGDISNARISRSSGDRDFDQSVLEAFRRFRSIGPTPNGKSDTWTVRFRTRDD